VRDELVDRGGLQRNHGGLLRINDGLLRDTRAEPFHLPLLNARLLPLPPAAAAAARCSTPVPHS
jgi:hypothetical protein